MGGPKLPGSEGIHVSKCELSIFRVGNEITCTRTISKPGFISETLRCATLVRVLADISPIEKSKSCEAFGGAKNAYLFNL